MFTTKYDQIKACKKCKLRTTRSILELNFLYFFSGTTWVQEIVWQILNDGRISEERVESRYPFLEKSQLFDRPGDESDGQKVSVTSRPSPRLIKSHLPYHVIPMSKEESKRSKYIYVARNPKDVAVSFYHFVQSFDPGSYFNGTWEFFVKLFLEGKSKDFYLLKMVFTVSYAEVWRHWELASYCIWKFATWGKTSSLPLLPVRTSSSLNLSKLSWFRQQKNTFCLRDCLGEVE